MFFRPEKPLPKVIRRISPLIFLVFSLTIFSCAKNKSLFLQGDIIDLTYPFDNETIYWPTGEDFALEQESRGKTERGYFYAANRFHASEHGGTHMDAPSHFAEGKHSIEQIPPSQLIGPGYVVDVSARALRNPDMQVSVEDFLEWEKTHGRIPEGAIVLIKTGYGIYWPNREKYLGTAQRGKEALALLHFPGLDPGAARWLTTNRNIKAVGIDTASIDFGQSENFLSHQTLFQANIPAIENVASLEKIPQRGFIVMALPMKIAGGTGAPTRVFALLPRKN
jgi:kynurenine formamidase